MAVTNCWKTVLMVLPLLHIGEPKINAAPFDNLNFEKGRFTGDFPTTDTTERLIPSWTLTFDGEVQSFMGAGTGPAGTPGAWLADRRFDNNVIQGRFSLALQPGFTTPSEPRRFAHYGLSQSGDVPLESQSLRFQGQYGVFDVRINGVQIDLVDESHLDLWYGADIGEFAGQTVLLEFFTSEGSPELGSPPHIIDSIEFSPFPVVPEPSPWSIFLGGLVTFCCLRRRQK